jgi:hypothetical protein
LLDWLPWVIVAGFATIFLAAGVHEWRRRRTLDAPEDPRDAFTFDPEAPSYEEPPADTDETEPAGDAPAARKTGTGEAPEDTKGERRQ